jgi:hypothetical protein
MSDKTENMVNNSADEPSTVEQQTEQKETRQESQEKMLRQSDVEKLLHKRLKEKEESIMGSLGVSLDEAKAIIKEREDKELELQKRRGEFDEVLKKTVSKKDEEIATIKAELYKLRVDDSLLNSASNHKAIKPQQVTNLLKSNVKFEEGKAVVYSDDGGKRYSDNGEPLTIDELVKEFLDTNPHFVSPTPSGSGTRSAIGGQQQKEMSIADLNMSNPEHREIYRKMRVKNANAFVK